jgi:hypothetical protein
MSGTESDNKETWWLTRGAKSDGQHRGRDEGQHEETTREKSIGPEKGAAHVCSPKPGIVISAQAWSRCVNLWAKGVGGGEAPTALGARRWELPARGTRCTHSPECCVGQIKSRLTMDEGTTAAVSRGDASIPKVVDAKEAARRFSASAAAAFRVVVPLDRVKVAGVWNGRLCMWQMLSWRTTPGRQRTSSPSSPPLTAHRPRPTPV